MRSGFIITLMVAVIFAGGYWLYTVEAVCDVPLGYQVGSIDPNFDISFEEARTVIADAESLWEDATGRNLFTYDRTADFTINFVFDDRQAFYNAEQDLRTELENKGEISAEVHEEYERLRTQYENLKAAYESRVATYESRLAAHNEEVADWNRRGGAPEEIFENLEERQVELRTEQQELNALAKQLNTLVGELNEIGREGNGLVSAYNSVVEVYNNRFNDEREFTQGDYQGDRINIYQYTDFDELRLVLAHELGHALSLDHVEGENSIMYHFMGEQNLQDGLTESDIGEFQRVCGDEPFTLWSIL